MIQSRRLIGWKSTPHDRAVDAACAAWWGTPWSENACVRGAGVDCRWLVYGIARSLNPSLPKPAEAMAAMGTYARDVGMHDPAATRSAVLAIVKSANLAKATSKTLSAGLVLAVPCRIDTTQRPESWPDGSPRMGHALICTGTKNRLLHATPAGGVQYTSPAAFGMRFMDQIAGMFALEVPKR